MSMGNITTTKQTTNQAATRPLCFPDTPSGSGLHIEGTGK